MEKMKVQDNGRQSKEGDKMTNSPTLMEVRGSRLSCLLLTGLPRHNTAKVLTDLTDGNALVTPEDIWMPEGILKPDEAMIHGVFPPLDPARRQSLIDWWLQVQNRANTPNWDIVSSCTVENKPGLLLVEAKAHARELSSSGKKPGNVDNHDQIGRAIAEASSNLNNVLLGWALQRDHSYQLANRFAWAWKMADLGIPVVLVYLGFRNAIEIGDDTFVTHADWKACVFDHADTIVPHNAWGQRLDISGTPIFPLIRSLEMGFYP
jgi:hypothetical protein